MNRDAAMHRSALSTMLRRLRVHRRREAVVLEAKGVERRVVLEPGGEALAARVLDGVVLQVERRLARGGCSGVVRLQRQT